MVVANWRVGGRVGVALGPKVAICAFTTDPRGFAFQCDPKAWVGENALLVLPREGAGVVLPALTRYFETTGRIIELDAVRRGREKIDGALLPEWLVAATGAWAAARYSSSLR